MKNWVIAVILVILAAGIAANGYFYSQESNRLSEVQAQIATLKDGIAILADNISALNGTASDLTRDVTRLLTDTSTLKGDVSNLARDTATLGTNIAGLKGDISVLSGNLSALSSSIGSLQGEISSSFKAFQSYINAGQNTVARLAPVVVRVDVNGAGFQSSASGTIVNKRGYILTSQHVISGATSIKVILANGDQFDGSVVSSDVSRDLALLRIASSQDLPVIVLGTAADIVVGEDVLAIGFALGPDFAGAATVTKGIVSAMRTFQGVRYIQTDAAVNPGNSGGCLVTLDGKMIGVPTARIEGVGAQIQLIGFATPVDEVRTFIQDTLGAVLTAGS